MENNIWEQAARQGTRITNPGVGNTFCFTRLWELPLQGGSLCLEAVAQSIHHKQKGIDTTSFVTATKANLNQSLSDDLALQLALVKHVIAVKEKERAEAATSQLNAAKRQRLLAIKASREQGKEENLSDEDLQALIDDLS